MKFFADASYLGNLYYPGGEFEPVARRLRDHQEIKPVFTIAVRLEFWLGALWVAGRQDGWKQFLADVEEKRLNEEAVTWDSLFKGFETGVLQHGRSAKPDLLDGLHVLSARQLGATHFLSFDRKSRQRTFARALGMKVLPERMPGETAT